MPVKLLLFPVKSLTLFLRQWMLYLKSADVPRKPVKKLGEITADEILEAAAEIAGAVSEEKEDPQADETEEKEGAPNMQKKSNPAPVQRKYSSIYMQRPVTGRGQMKSIPPIIQLARAVKCLDVFGRHDPDAAAYFARRKYDDSEMEREFKALNATNPASAAISFLNAISIRLSKCSMQRLSSSSWVHRRFPWLMVI